MIDLAINRPARQCAFTGELFEPGADVVSFLFLGKDGYERVDVRAAQAEAYKPGRVPICRWLWHVRDAASAEKESARAAMAQNEEFFLALCHAESGSDEAGVEAERSALRHLMCLMLQRKRLVKPVPGRKDTYLHISSGQEVVVPPPTNLTPKLLQRIAPQLGG